MPEISIMMKWMHQADARYLSGSWASCYLLIWLADWLTYLQAVLLVLPACLSVCPARAYNSKTKKAWTSQNWRKRSPGQD